MYLWHTVVAVGCRCAQQARPRQVMHCPAAELTRLCLPDQELGHSLPEHPPSQTAPSYASARPASSRALSTKALICNKHVACLSRSFGDTLLSAPKDELGLVKGPDTGLATDKRSDNGIIEQHTWDCYMSCEGGGGSISDWFSRVHECPLSLVQVQIRSALERETMEQEDVPGVLLRALS